MALRSDSEIEDELNVPDPEDVVGGISKFPSMTYEQGVDAALRWVLGWEDEPPFK